jgi:hypothetical protein
MKARCYNPHTLHYADYGGRGITVCHEWQEYEPFRDWARDSGYQDGVQLDRIDNNGPYSPSNCRFTTTRTQTRNKRSNIWITAFGETKIISDWLRDPRCQVTVTGTILKRLKAGLAPEEAITRPPRSIHPRRTPDKPGYPNTKTVKGDT